MLYSFIAGFLAGLATLSSGYRDLAATIIPYLPEHQPQQQVVQAQVLFGGDMMFDRTVRTTIKYKGGDFVFSCLDPLLRQQDAVVANLEGPITPNASLSATSTPGDAFNMTFTFPLSTGDLLYAHRIRMVNIGNNHIENFGTGGVRSTIAALSTAGVDYFGDPIAQHVASADIRGVPLALINYNEFAGNPARNASTTIAQIRAAHIAGYLPVVYTHWGIEYATTSPQYIRDLAHRFVDAGAEVVIGSHPHVVEDHELYHGKYIYYSLGNLIFDQYWNYAVTHGLMLQVTFTSAGVQTIKEVPVVLNRDRTTCPVD